MTELSSCVYYHPYPSHELTHIFLFPRLGSVPIGATHPSRSGVRPSTKHSLPRRKVNPAYMPQSNTECTTPLQRSSAAIPQSLPAQENRSFVCNICGIIFFNPFKYKEHQREHRNLDKLRPGQLPGERFQCRFCPRRFSYRVYLVRHERSHTGEKPFACSICGKRFGLSSNLYQHERRSHGRIPSSTV